MKVSEALTLTATTNIQHSPAPSQSNIKTHTKSLTASVPITQNLRPAFNNNNDNKITRHKRETHSEKIKQPSEPDSGHRLMEPGNRESKVSMINMLMVLMEKMGM